jgi:hypothetical protein
MIRLAVADPRRSPLTQAVRGTYTGRSQTAALLVRFDFFAQQHTPAWVVERFFARWRKP